MYCSNTALFAAAAAVAAGYYIIYRQAEGPGLEQGATGGADQGKVYWHGPA
jgi:hypothetical protein